MLKEIVDKVFLGELMGGVGEVDRSVLRDFDVLEEAVGSSFVLGAEGGDVFFGVNGEESSVGVGDDEISGCVEV